MATNNRQLGGYRDAHLEIEKLARSTGDIMESAVQELIGTHAQYFRNDGPDLKHVLTGETIEDFVGTLKKTKPHFYASYAPLSEEQALEEMIEDAMLSPTPGKLGKLYKQVGEVRYNELCAAWGTDPVRMRPGVRPEWARRPEQKKIADRRGNPWSKEGWNLTKQMGLVKSIGIEKAAAMARSVGCVVGSTKPNLDPRYN
jgi:hypothetical protein